MYLYNLFDMAMYYSIYLGMIRSVIYIFQSKNMNKTGEKCRPKAMFVQFVHNIEHVKADDVYMYLVERFELLSSLTYRSVMKPADQLKSQFKAK